MRAQIGVSADLKFEDKWEVLFHKVTFDVDVNVNVEVTNTINKRSPMVT